MIKIHRPLCGSDANECTDVNIPDLTRKVPIRLKENVKIDNNNVHSLCWPVDL